MENDTPKDLVSLNIDRLSKMLESGVGAQMTIQDFAEMQIALEDLKKSYSGEKSRLESELKDANRELANQNKFYSAVIHDVRSPLTAISGFSSMPIDDLSREEIQSNLDNINLASGKAKGLADTIVSYKNVLTGKELNKEEFILKECLDSVYSLNKYGVEAKGLEFNLEYNPVQSIVMNTDRQLFERIFDNLISNAVKFTGKGHIELGVYEVFGGGLKLYVEDTGIGISEEFRDKVFDMNTQVNAKDAKQGMGYGLSIVKDFTTALGGQIKVDSTPDEGSTFYVLMPRKHTRKFK